MERTRPLAGRLLAVLATVLAPVLLLAPPVGADEPEVVAGLEVVARQELAPGLSHLTLQGGDPGLVVHVARLAPDAGLRLRPVLAQGSLAGPGPDLERTSGMCRRVGCLVAVNADFFHLDTHQPVGGMVVDGRVVRSASPLHHQLVVPGGTGAPSIERFATSVRLMTTDFGELASAAVNVRRDPDALVLYTPAWGPSTGTNPHGVELVVRVVQPAGPLRAGQTALVRLLALEDGKGDAAIPSDGVVLSGHGEAAASMRSLWERVQSGQAAPTALLRVEVDPAAAESVGGAPVLVRDGARYVAATADSFTAGRHPRTMVGWTAAGEILLVTVDGRGAGNSTGLSLPAAADLMIELGAVEALNLDGGGSTTFVVGGDVANRPSDRLVRRNGRERLVTVDRAGDHVLGHVERPTVSALAIVPEGSPAPAPADPLAGADAQLPESEPTTLPVPAAVDPASNLEYALPAVVPGTAGADPADRVPLALSAAVAVVLAAAGTGVVGARRRRPESVQPPEGRSAA